jgi:hypothetical protein
MTKLIAAYLAKPTLKNAIKLQMYSKMHPMSVCTLGAEENAVLQAALVQCGSRIIFTHIGQE